MTKRLNTFATLAAISATMIAMNPYDHTLASLLVPDRTKETNEHRALRLKRKADKKFRAKGKK